MPKRTSLAQPTPAHFRAPGTLPGYRSFSHEEEARKYKAAAAQLEVKGPRRSSPAFYAGESYRRHNVQYPDAERWPNGALPARHDKLARRIIRGALKNRFSSVTKPLRLAQGLRAQAYEAARDDQPKGAKRGRWARRLLAKELAIHQTVYVPADLRALRTAKRKRLRAGLAGDAISALVDRMAKKP